MPGVLFIVNIPTEQEEESIDSKNEEKKESVKNENGIFEIVRISIDSIFFYNSKIL